MNNNIGEIIFDEDAIAKKVTELAERINNDYKGQELILVCILKGSFAFTADLARKLNVKCKIEFMQVSSYDNSTQSSGSIKIIKDINIPVDGKNLLIIEDIIDTGITLNNLKNMLQIRNPASIKLCAFLDKKCKRIADIDADYVGYEVDDHFLVGYGLDYAQDYRNLPYIAVLKKEIYTK